MNAFIKLIEIFMSWPAITLWLGIIFRNDVGRLLRRIQSIELPHLEGSFKTERRKE